MAMTAKTWLITGCSSGLGSLFIPAVLARGDCVIATARNTSTLTEFQLNERVKIMQLDVTASQKVLDEKVAEAWAMFGKIDVLVNNAGYVAPGVWEEAGSDQVYSLFATHIFGPLNLTRSILPRFRENSSGVVVFMSSIAAWRGVAAGGPYSSSKFALEGAVECLAQEVAHFGVRTHLFVLGAFRTSILEPSRIKPTISRSLPCYEEITAKYRNRQSESNGKQLGDPVSAVERMIDVVRREGSVSDLPNLPLRIPLGSDAVKIMRAKCHETLQVVDTFEGLSKSTDYADASDAPGYE